MGNRLPVPKLVHCCGTELVLGAPDNAIIFTSADANSKPRSLASGEPFPAASSAISLAQEEIIMVDQLRLAIRGRLSLSLSNKLDDIAELFEISPRTLKRRLNETGTTFSELVEEVKVTEAKRLLAESDLPISEIAHSLMYSQLPSFSRAFSNSTGVSPSEFRASNNSVG